MSNNPNRIGVTGGIGSGKSVVCSFFKTLKVPVYDSDFRAKFLMSHDSTLMKEIRMLFGEKSYHQGRLNSSYLASKVFNNGSALSKLNGLVHPAVARDFESWVSSTTHDIVVKEAALLFESGSYKGLDKVILVTAPKGVRIQRVRTRDPYRDKSQIMNIMKKQWSDEDKRKLADFEVVNDDEQMVLPRVLEIYESLTELVR